MLKKTIVTKEGEVIVEQAHNSFILEASVEQIIALCQQLGLGGISRPGDLRQLGEIKPQASPADKPSLVLEETDINGRLQLSLTDEQFILRLRDQCAVKAESPSQSPDLTVIQQRLQARYEQNSQIKRLFYPDTPWALKDCYLHLALLKDEKRQEEKPSMGTEKTAQRDYILREYERIQHSQEKLEVSEILTQCLVTGPRRIYIEGAAGAGKSTLCRYIAYQWATGQAPWSNYAWVFVIRLRELAKEPYAAKKGLDFIRLIENRCLQTGAGNSLNKAERKALLVALKQAPRQVLLVLDGLDELGDEPSANAIWESLVQSDYDLLMTARPGVPYVRKEAVKIKLSLAVIGFSDKQVTQYVTQFFNQTPGLAPKDATPCLALLKTRPDIWSLAHTPIQLEFICSIWGKELQALQPFTLTGLYDLMLDKILARQANKQNPQARMGQLVHLQRDKRYQASLDYMGRLAFLGMQHKQIVLSAQTMYDAYEELAQQNNEEQDQLWQLLEEIGLVKRCNEGAQAEFAHLTFQEYFAARYVVCSIKACWGQPQSAPLAGGLDNPALQELIAATKFDSFYTVMWGFVAGLLARVYPNQPQPPVFQRLVDSFLASPRTELDLAELSLLLRCLEEAPGIVIAQHPQLMANLQRWAEFYVTCDYDLEGTLLEKLWQTLRACPSLVGRLVQAKPAILNLLGEQLQHENYVLSDWAVQTLGSWGRFLPAVAHVLLQWLAHTKQEVRRDAAYAVRAIGARASVELQRGLTALLADEYESVRYAAARAVGQLGAQASAELQRGLAALLADEDVEVRRDAAEAVRDLGVQARAELQAVLMTLSTHPQEDVRHDVMQALANLPQTFEHFCRQLLAERFPVPLRAMGSEALSQPPLSSIAERLAPTPSPALSPSLVLHSFPTPKRSVSLEQEGSSSDNPQRAKKARFS